MAPNATDPAAAAAATGSGELSFDGDISLLEQKAPQKQARLDPAAAIIVAAWSDIARDLLAESIEFAIGYGVNILAAIRQGDDAATVAEFRGFDASARTARHCAERIREKQAFLDREAP